MTRKKYPDEVIAFARKHGSKGSLDDMRIKLRQEFGMELKYTQVQTLFKNYKIRAAPLKGRIQPNRRIVTPEQDAFIKANLKGTGYQAMADLLNKTFGTSFTRKQMESYYSNHKLKCGVDTRYKKGCVPANKGKTWDEYMSVESQANSRKSQFKKGQTPMNQVPVGTIKIRNTRSKKSNDKKPYYWEKIAHPKTWRPKHILEWEKHNGPIPEGYIVTFANGNTLDYSIDNLVLSTLAQHAVKNRTGLQGYDKESALTANKIADMRIAIHKRKTKKGRKKGRK